MANEMWVMTIGQNLGVEVEFERKMVLGRRAGSKEVLSANHSANH